MVGLWSTLSSLMRKMISTFGPVSGTIRYTQFMVRLFAFTRRTNLEVLKWKVKCGNVPGPETPLLGGVSPIPRWSNREERPGNVTLNARCKPKGQLSNPKLNCKGLEENLRDRSLTKHEKVLKSPRWCHPYGRSCLCETGWLPLCPASALTHWFHSTELSFW